MEWLRYHEYGEKEQGRVVRQICSAAFHERMNRHDENGKQQGKLFLVVEPLHAGGGDGKSADKVQDAAMDEDAHVHVVDDMIGISL